MADERIEQLKNGIIDDVETELSKFLDIDGHRLRRHRAEDFLERIKELRHLELVRGAIAAARK